MKSTDETKALAKEAGIKSWHMKKEETLLAELAMLDVTAETATIEIESTEAQETETVSIEPIKTESKLELPSGVTAEKVWASVRAMKNKSALWEFRSLAKAPSDFRG